MARRRNTGIESKQLLHSLGNGVWFARTRSPTIAEVIPCQYAEGFHFFEFTIFQWTTFGLARGMHVKELAVVDHEVSYMPDKAKKVLKWYDQKSRHYEVKV